MMKYSWEQIAEAEKEYNALDNAVDTLCTVIRDLRDIPEQKSLMDSLQELVDESRNRIDEIFDIVMYGDNLQMSSMNFEYERDAL